MSKHYEYDVAQICMNGHVVNSATENEPLESAPFCDECGASTITQCPACNAPIPGARLTVNQIDRGFNYGHTWVEVSPYFGKKPHCKSCGAAYPWTSSQLEAASALAIEIGGLEGEDAVTFSENFPEIMRETAKTELAAHRVKKLLTKIGGPVAKGIRDIVVEIASEAAKKIILEQGKGIL